MRPLTVLTTNEENNTVVRVRTGTLAGYSDCNIPCIINKAFQNTVSRTRCIGGGYISQTVLCSVNSQFVCIVEM